MGGKTAEELIVLERRLLTMFAQRGRAFQEMGRDEWEDMFLLQHYGGPTRLLDWSENPFVALYFALTDSERHDFPEDATVWVMDPVAWNRGALTHMSFAGGILAVGDAELGGYKPNSTPDLMNTDPVNLYSIHNRPE